MTQLQLLNITNKQRERERGHFCPQKANTHCLDYDWDSKLVCVSKIGNGSNMVLWYSAMVAVYIRSLAGYRR